MEKETKPQFAYPLAIEGTREQLEALVPKLREIGYEDSYCGFVNYKVDSPYLLTHFGGTKYRWGFNNTPNGHTLLSASNPNLVLALAAMREGNKFYQGESVIFVGEGGMRHNDSYTLGKLYTVRDWEKKREKYHNNLHTELDDKGSTSNAWRDELFRKATKEEIITHYEKKEEKGWLNKEEWIGQAGERGPSNSTDIGGAVFFNNTFVNEEKEKSKEMKEEKRKIQGYKLKKEYPGSRTKGSEISKAECDHLYALYPEFFEPIYEEEKPLTMDYLTIGSLGTVRFNRKEETVIIRNEKYRIDHIQQAINSLTTPRDIEYGFRDKHPIMIESVQVGCKQDIKIAHLQDMLMAYDKFVNS